MAEELSKEEIEILSLKLAIKLSKEKLEADIKSIVDANARHEKQHDLMMKTLEIQLMQARETMRPHRLYHATVGKDTETGKYFCRTLEYENPEEEPFELSAFGDTPAEACDNFDALWIGTHNE